MAVDKILQPASLLFAAAVRSPNQCKMSGSSCGHLLPLNITELQVAGFAHVTSIKPCPRIASGEGSVVTARFITREVNSIVRAEILGPDGKIEVIEGTPIHPIWSVDRDDWVELGELQQGEQLLGQAGPAIVLSVTILNHPTAVYNIEVHGEHVYQVGELSVLVHNAYFSDFRFRGAVRIDGLREATHADIVKAFDGAGVSLSNHFITRLK